MWIKQTTVKKSNAEYTYYQLMKTVYENGRSKQIVVANLGRKGQVREEHIYRLAEVMTDETYLFLPDDLLSLLPVKRYGETFLLNKAFEITSLRRFLEDLAEFKCLGSDSVSALLTLLSYYSFQQHTPSIRNFLQKYYIRAESECKSSSFLEAFRLLHGTPQVHPGIITNYSRLKNSHRLKCYYHFAIPAANSLVESGSLPALVMTDEAGFPLFYTRDQNRADPAIAVGCESLHIYEAFYPMLLAERASSHYISRITPKQLGALTGQKIPELLREYSDCERYGEMTYSVIPFDDFRAIVLRPFSLFTDYAPSELLITNLTSEVPDILNWFYKIDTLQEVFYRIFLPKDLAFLKEEFSAAEIVDVLLNIHFLRLFMENQLSVKLEPLNINARDAYDLCRNMRIVSLKYGNQRQLLHSIYSPMETKILEFLAFN